MPNYAFECTGCGERFEITESVTTHDRHKEKCPKCKSKKVRQVYSTFFAKTSRKS